MKVMWQYWDNYDESDNIGTNIMKVTILWQLWWKFNNIGTIMMKVTILGREGKWRHLAGEWFLILTLSVLAARLKTRQNYLWQKKLWEDNFDNKKGIKRDKKVKNKRTRNNSDTLSWQRNKTKKSMTWKMGEN